MFVKLIWLIPIPHALQVGLYLTHSPVTQVVSVTMQWSCDPLTCCTLKLGLTEQRRSLIFRAARDEPPCISPTGDPRGVTLLLHPFHSYAPRPAPVCPAISCQHSPGIGKRSP